MYPREGFESPETCTGNLPGAPALLLICTKWRSGGHLLQ